MPFDSATGNSSLLATFLRARAQQLRLSQTEIFRRMASLEKNSGSLSSVNGWFTGDRCPGEAELRALATILEVAPDSLFALHALENDVVRQRSVITTALSVWPLMVGGHERVLLLAGATMLTGVTQLRSAGNLDGTTVLVSTLAVQLLADYERSLNGSRRDSAFLRASWLATVDLLLDLASEPSGPRVRLWLRDEHTISPAFEGKQLVANDWMLVEAETPDARSFDVHVFGKERWSDAAALIQELQSRDDLPGAKVAFDSKWTSDDPRREQFASYCSEVSLQVARITRR